MRCLIRTTFLHAAHASLGVVVVVCLLTTGAWTSVQAEQPKRTEYEVKAAYLYQFPKFIEWKEDAFSSEESPLIIAILGEDPFGEVIDKIVENRLIGRHPVEIKRFPRLSDLSRCHVLFVSRSEHSHIDEVLQTVRSQNILTVGDTEDFAEQGGVINFFIDENKVRFEINLAASREAGLKISSKLLRVTPRIVEK